MESAHSQLQRQSAAQQPCMRLHNFKCVKYRFASCSVKVVDPLRCVRCRVLQLYQMREMAPMLLPVLATMLQFSPAEVAKCQEASSRTEAPAGANAASCRF